MALFSTITDDFDDGVLSLPKWEGSSVEDIREEGGRLRLASTTGYPNLRTPASHTLLASSIYAQVFPAPRGNSTGVVNSEMLLDSPTGGTRLLIAVNTVTNQIQFRSDVGYGDANGVNITYDPVAHRWWRMREASGQVYMETSPNASTWTIRRQVATPAWVITGNNPIIFSTHRDNGDLIYSMEIDNVNTPAKAVAVPGVPTNVAVIPYDTRAMVSWIGNDQAMDYDIEHEIVEVSEHTVQPWSPVTLTSSSVGTWTQTLGNAVTLGGTGSTRTFIAPPSMNNQTLEFTFGGKTFVVNVPRASTGIKVADGSVLPVRFSAKGSTGPASVTIDAGTITPTITITPDTNDAGTFTTNLVADTSDPGTFGSGLTADTSDVGTFLLTGSAPATQPTGLKPTSATQSAMDTSVRTLWANWKTNIRQKPENGWYAVLANAQVDPVTGVAENPYVAEGQGYGLLAAVQMADVDSEAKTIFDGITKFVLDHPSAIDSRLHAAEQDVNMVSHNGANSATDGDMDIAMAHLMAHKKWGSTGTHNYRQLALNRITALKESLISPTTGLLELGDWSSDTSAQAGGKNWPNHSRPSDWMIGHFEAFYKATGDTVWNTAITSHLNAVKRLQDVYAPSTGLLPDFTQNPPATIQPVAPNFLEGPNDGDYYYNACRTPWRLGTASAQASRDAALKMATWAKTKCNGNPATLPTGFKLDGTAIGNYQDMAFIAPFGVAATCGSDQAWVNAIWDYLDARSNNTNYYDGSIQLLCMIAMSGTYVVNP